MVMETPTTVIKLSGKALQAKAELHRLFAAMRGLSCMVVHGGGVEADDLLKKLGFTTKRLNGLRVTGKDELYYITAAFGACGRYLQADAAKAGLKALSMTCSDYEFLRVKRLAPEYGEVGTCRPHSCKGILDLFAHGFTPLVCSLGIAEDGSILNINADDAAAAAAAALDARLIFLSDVPGVLDAEGQLIEQLTEAEADALTAAGVITGGMAVKVRQAFACAKQCRRDLVIASIFDPKIIDYVEHGAACGTTVLCGSQA